MFRAAYLRCGESSESVHNIQSDRGAYRIEPLGRQESCQGALVVSLRSEGFRERQLRSHRIRAQRDSFASRFQRLIQLVLKNVAQAQLNSGGYTIGRNA